MATGSPQADPMSLMRMVMAHRKISQSPFSQLQDAGGDMLQPPSSPFAQVFQRQAKPLVPGAAPGAPVGVEPPKAAPQVAAQAPVLARSTQAPQPQPRAPIEQQGPMPTTPFQDRMGDVSMAIADGTFDPQGANTTAFTTFGHDLHGVGHTPGLRFVDAAAKSAGIEAPKPQKFKPEGEANNFIESLGGVKVNPQNWDRMLAETQAHGNVEDRRGEPPTEDDVIGELIQEMDKQRRGGEGK